MESSPIQTLRKEQPAGGRQAFFFSVVLGLTGLATWVLADILWRGGLSGTEAVLLGLFVPLFAMISLGFIQAVFGFAILWRRNDPYLVSRLPGAGPAPAADLPATAIVIPIYNEDVSRVYEGLRTIYLSLVRSGHLQRFDFFILSDSNDPNKWIEEEIAWLDLCKQLKGFGRIFYRKRNIALNRKSGNLSDFCRRWGGKYRYMVVLDADSLMQSRTLVRLVQLMEANPMAGIIQSVPLPVQGKTLYARVMQFAGTLYGPIFQAGLNYWQGGIGNYWGHNAIIRLAPFMEHCALPSIPGATQHSRFMSHDYVEAALMRKAGYEVWMAYDLEGSFESLPPTLVDAAKRDRRWCRGNLQHSWLLMARGLHPVNRLHLFLGIMSYVSSPLWLFFILIGTFLCYMENRFPQSRFDADVGLSALLDNVGMVKLAFLLFVVTMGLLTVPKVLALILVLRDRFRRTGFGGFLPLTFSVIIEHLLSALLAPVHMLFNSKFVFQILMGREVGWGTQRRVSGGVDWREVVLIYYSHTAAGIGLGWLAWWISPAFFWWISPITLGLVLSIPLSIALGDTRLGAALARIRLFVTPQELTPPPLIRRLEKSLEAVGRQIPVAEWLRPHNGVMQAVLDPYINTAHVSLLRQKRQHSYPVTDYIVQLQTRLLSQGPAVLNRREQMALLMNAQAMTDLHDRIWSLPEAKLSPWWKMAMRHYNTVAVRPATPLYR